MSNPQHNSISNRNRSNPQQHQHQHHHHHQGRFATMSQNQQNRTGSGSTWLGLLAAAGTGALLGYLGSEIMTNAATQNAPHTHRHVPMCPPSECCICSDDLQAPIEQLPCSHMFHKQCLLKWLNTSASCPVCRHTLTGTQLNAYKSR